MSGRDANQLSRWDTALHRAETTPIGIDLSDYSDEWAEGFLAGQRSILEEVQAGTFVLPPQLAIRDALRVIQSAPLGQLTVDEWTLVRRILQGAGQ